MDKIKLITEKIIRFLKEAKSELKKVTWPTRKQTLASTSVVIIVVVIVSIFLGIVDFGLAKVIRLVLG
jgi:preprotein translocase subunit SecE